jgi:phospholipase C
VPDDDPQLFGRYGVRVPALIVSPWIEPGSVSSTVFDHTSIIKTILQRFCPDALYEPKRHHGLLARAGRAGYLGTRVAHAHDLGELLTRTVPRPAPARYALIQEAAAHAAARRQGTPAGQDALGREPATDLQIRIAAATRELRRRGHPANRP